MTTSLDVMEHLGDVDLLLPRRIQAGLSANDRLKYYLTLLQAAVAGAHEPQSNPPDLRDTRDASGVTDAGLDDVVPHSRLLGDGSVVVPSAAHIRQLVFADLGEMLAPVRAAAQGIPDLQDAVERFDARLRALDTATPRFDGDRVPTGAVDAMTARGTTTQDSVHQLVMDLHRQINRLQRRMPLRDVAGASTWGLGDGDEAAVSAFMEGLSHTSPLKFDHPGLETTATRVGGRLSIQNDLGTTDAHVVVLHIDGLAVTVIYSDVHRQRVAFFQRMLDGHDVAWAEAAGGGTGAPLMVVGRRVADSLASLHQFLAFCASRLVFLIDWNRARKQLGRFVRNADAVAILEWAADNDIGHRAFVQCGGADLIYAALERVAARHAVAGGRLDGLIGRDAAITFLRAVLRTASADVAAGRSDRVIRDEVEARLLACLAGGPHSGLGVLADHAAYLASLAERVRRVLLPGAGHKDRARGARLATRWKTRADELVSRQHETRDDRSSGDRLGRMIGHAGDAVDGLEDAAFLITLVPDSTTEPSWRSLAAVADLVLNGTRDYVRCVEHARDATQHRGEADRDEFLRAVNRVVDSGRAVNEAHRHAYAALLATCVDFRELHVLTAVTRALQQAADGLARSARAIRDYVMSHTA